MKKGDKITCIKDYIFCGNLYNIRNNTYKIVDSNKYNIDYVAVSCEYCGEDGEDNKDTPYCIFTHKEYKTYFSELIEQRKLKLKKLNEKM